MLTNVFTGRPARGIEEPRRCARSGRSRAMRRRFRSRGGALAPLRAKAEAAGSGDFSPLWTGQAGPLGARNAGRRADHHPRRRSVECDARTRRGTVTQVGAGLAGRPRQALFRRVFRPDEAVGDRFLHARGGALQGKMRASAISAIAGTMVASASTGSPIAAATAEPSSPPPIWKKPESAAAAPAMRGNGASDSVSMDGMTKGMPKAKHADRPHDGQEARLGQRQQDRQEQPADADEARARAAPADAPRPNAAAAA